MGAVRRDDGRAEACRPPAGVGRSGNMCAYPNCGARLTEPIEGKVGPTGYPVEMAVAEEAHIVGREGQRPAWGSQYGAGRAQLIQEHHLAMSQALRTLFVGVECPDVEALNPM